MASNRCFRRWSKRLPSVFEAFRSSSARLSCCSWRCWCMLMPYLAMLTWRENKWKQWQGLTRRLSTSSHTLTRCALMVSFTCGYYPLLLQYKFSRPRVASVYNHVACAQLAWGLTKLVLEATEISIKSKPTAVILMLFSGFTLLTQHSHPLAQSTPPRFCWEYHNRKILC